MARAPDALAGFPRRPLKLRFGWRVQTSIGFGALMVAGLLGWLLYLCATEIPELLQEQRIWRDGRVVAAQGVQGECTYYVNFMLLARCDLFVSYERTPGQLVRHEVEGLVFGGMDSALPPPLVKVDPADPDRFALGSMVDQSGSRWAALAEVAVAVVVVCALIGWGVWMSLRDVLLWRALARDPQPAWVRLTGSRLLRIPNTAREVRFAYERDGRSLTAKQRFAVLPAKRGTPRSAWQYEAPITPDAQGTTGLALIGPKGARLVPTGLNPLVLTEEEKARVLR